MPSSGQVFVAWNAGKGSAAFCTRNSGIYPHQRSAERNGASPRNFGPGADIHPKVNPDQDALEKHAREEIIAGTSPRPASIHSQAPTASQAPTDPQAPADSQAPADPGAPPLSAPDHGTLRPRLPLPGHGIFSAHPSRNRLNLFILRHASAGTRRDNPKIDIKRPLDKDGKSHCLHLAHVLNGLKLSFDLIVSSPLKRCLQTAQLIGTETGYETRILHSKALEPEATYAQFQRLIAECRTFENVLVVGHNPTLTQFLGHLIAPVAPATSPDAEAVPRPAQVRMRKGTIARVSFDRSPALLQWMLDPRLVRALYDTSTKSARRKVSRK